MVPEQCFQWPRGSMKKIDTGSVISIVEKMSPEELEIFRDLVHECLAREKDYIEIDEQLHSDIERLQAAEGNLARSLSLLNSRIREIQDSLGGNGTGRTVCDNPGTDSWGRKIH